MYLNQATENDHLSKSSQNIQSVYYKYKEAIQKFGSDVEVYCTKKKYIGFKAKYRIAVFHFNPAHIKVWFNLRPGELKDPKGIVLVTEKGHTLRIDSDKDFDYIVGLFKQSYDKNR